VSSCEGHISFYKYYFINSNGGNVMSWDTKVVTEFYDNPMVNKSKILVLLEQIWDLSVYGKNRGF